MGEWIGLPVAASAHALEIDRLIVYIHVAMFAALLLWGAFYVIPIVRFRQRRHPEASHRGIRGWWPFAAVAVMTIVELGLLIGISLPFWEEHVAAAPEITPNTIEVRVVGQQFQWNIHYPGADGIFGRTSAEFVDGQLNLLGLDPNDPNGKDDVTSLNQMFLPVNRPVVAYLSTKDVIHSMHLPEFRVKQDAIPGMRIPVQFTPTLTSAEFGRPFEIACAQLCGLSHYQMRGFLNVGTDAEFDAWMANELERRQAAADADWLFNP